MFQWQNVTKDKTHKLILENASVSKVGRSDVFTTQAQSYEQFKSLYLQGYYLYSQVMAKFQPFETFFPRIYEEILLRFGTCEKDLGTLLVG